ncbi:arad-like aldolase/epimerase [Mycena metata]|uniref:Arad-like aldolase/epimerase n=1 Tax=Mycena metata TaxID=1033252 RepID=A0AAD7JUP5_9AGAR|nr:arad-like aldolase/epimerase [Mycena metata]
MRFTPNSLLAGLVFSGFGLLVAADTDATVSTTAAAIPANVTAAVIDLLDANHILHFLDVVDAFGHVSVRNPVNSSQFFMSYAIAPALTTSQHIVTYAINNATAVALTFNSSVVGAKVPTGFAERYIHSEIYKKFPTVMAVVHSHTQEILPFANQATVPFVSQIHTSPAVGDVGVPIFDTRTLSANVLATSALHDLLVRTEAVGDALAAKFVTGSSVVLMRGHGMAVHSTSIRDVVLNTFYVKQDATVQLQGILLGGGRVAPLSLNSLEIANASVTVHGSFVPRAWPLWVKQVDNNPVYENDLRGKAAPAATGF